MFVCNILSQLDIGHVHMYLRLTTGIKQLIRGLSLNKSHSPSLSILSSRCEALSHFPTPVVMSVGGITM